MASRVGFGILTFALESLMKLLRSNDSERLISVLTAVSVYTKISHSFVFNWIRSLLS